MPQISISIEEISRIATTESNLKMMDSKNVCVVMLADSFQKASRNNRLPCVASFQEVPSSKLSGPGAQEYIVFKA